MNLQTERFDDDEVSDTFSGSIDVWSVDQTIPRPVFANPGKESSHSASSRSILMFYISHRQIILLTRKGAD